jgi:hypothetical protein
MTSDNPSSRSLAAWMDVLQRIQTSVDQLLQRADDTPLPPPSASLVLRPLHVLAEHLSQLQVCLDRAERNAAEIDRLLNAEVELMQQWLDRTRAVQDKLAGWEPRAVYRPAGPSDVSPKRKRGTALPLAGASGVCLFVH